MRQREGSQKTNLEAEVFQSYSFSEIWKYCKHVTASWISNVYPFKLCYDHDMNTSQ